MFERAEENAKKSAHWLKEHFSATGSEERGRGFRRGVI